jgi:YVTN family beta-propeller protein
MRNAVALAMVALGVLAGPADAQPYAYVLGQTDLPAAGNAGPQIVTVIDIATNTKVAAVTAGTGCQCVGPNALALTPDGTTLYVVNEIGDTVTVIATASNQVVDTLSSALIGTGPIAVRVSPDNARLYVLGGGGILSVIDRASRTRTGTVNVNAPQTRGLAVTPDGSRLYVSTYGSHTVKVVDTASLAVVTTVPMAAGSLPLGVDATPDGQYAFVAGLLGNTVTVIRTATNTVAATIPVGTGPFSVGVLPDGTRAYAPSPNSGTVSRIDTATLTGTGTIPNVGGNTIAFTADSALAYVAGNGGVRPVTLATSTVGTLIPIATATEGLPAAIVITPGAFVPPANPAPSGLAATITGNRVALTWQAPTSGAPTGYVLEGGVAPGEVLASVSTGSATPGYAFDAPTGVFYLRVHANSAAGRSPASNEIRISVNVPQAPSAPTNLLGLAAGDMLALTWKNTFAGGTPTTIVLDVSGALAGSASIGFGESFSFAGVPPGTYTFAVRAVNATGASTASSPVTLTFPSTCSGVPQTPANAVLTRAGSTLTFAWDPPAAGAAPTSYLVRAAGSIAGTATTTARILSGAVPPGNYALTVRAVNACGQSAETAPQTVTVP